MSNATATITGDCPVCGREDVTLRQYQRASGAGVAVACDDERACFHAWRDRKYADQ